jgi:hypothetical protein
VGTCWLHWGHRYKVIKMYPQTPGWAHFECSKLMWSQCTHTRNIQNVPKLCFQWAWQDIQNSTNMIAKLIGTGGKGWFTDPVNYK